MAVTALAITPAGAQTRAGSFGRDGGYSTPEFTAQTSSANAMAMDIRGFSGGGFYCSGAATITFLQGFADAPTTLVQAYDTKDRTAPAAITVVVGAAGYYDLPVELWTCEILGVYASAGVTLRFSFKK